MPVRGWESGETSTTILISAPGAGRAGASALWSLRRAYVSCRLLLDEGVEVRPELAVVAVTGDDLGGHTCRGDREADDAPAVLGLEWHPERRRSLRRDRDARRGLPAHERRHAAQLAGEERRVGMEPDEEPPA